MRYKRPSKLNQLKNEIKELQEALNEARREKNKLANILNNAEQALNARLGYKLEGDTLAGSIYRLRDNVSQNLSLCEALEKENDHLWHLIRSLTGDKTLEWEKPKEDCLCEGDGGRYAGMLDPVMPKKTGKTYTWHRYQPLK